MNDWRTAIVAVPFDAVDELEREGLAFALPVFRGAAVEAVVTIGMDAAALVTLMQAPDAVRAFASWIRASCRRAGNTLEISVKQGGRRVHLAVDGEIDAGIVADFLTAALAGRPAAPQDNILVVTAKSW